MSDREKLLRLLNRYAEESHGIAEAFAARERLHPTDLQALLMVIEAGRSGTAITPAELAARLGRSSGSVSTAVDRLERAGHLRRERDTADRRRVHLYRSDSGAGVAGQYFAGLAARAGTVLDTFDETELATIERFLTSIVAAMGEHREQA
ncbi:MarR family transcriptional regulator [Amycolatopsis antarctica]|uniref:MarR family transcriptional regulator n=1 Tax=Amycolatopsis antarctica TaxID=1854586 RepID=A0A263D8D1_9PSEU|nr:MarR family transcriptional regulator [Amycolatopsis antarctica]OZM74762.1 MarR family transcriptional regulator [Amycolatopsis antarctica]